MKNSEKLLSLDNHNKIKNSDPAAPPNNTSSIEERQQHEGELQSRNRQQQEDQEQNQQEQQHKPQQQHELELEQQQQQQQQKQQQQERRNQKEAEQQQQQNNEYEYIFGYGSIMNSSTHAPWLGNLDGAAPLPGVVATLGGSFGYERCWNFRSSTGFTALGVRRSRHATTAGSVHNNNNTISGSDINAVLFRVPSSMIPGFDHREVGYEKVAIGREHLKLHHHNSKTEQRNNESLTLTQQQPNESVLHDIGPEDRIWLYVPLPSYCAEPDENHPLLQSYVDTVLQGCLEWGGEEMAEQFIVSTGAWSAYFLNDTPSSRRPWLFRKEYETIDRVLRKHSDTTHYGDRRHPEEFASAFLIRRMRGTWSLPRRNPNFTGRDKELGQIHARLQHDQNNNSSSLSSSSVVGISKLEVTGMGGVGKTQICAEYCYRHFPSSYGLVVWLNAESAEALLADYRQLLADLADGSVVDYVNAKDNEVVSEVKTRFFRSQVPWLLVFDNLEGDHRKLLDKFVPRGAGTRGHVLVTTRHVDIMELGPGSGGGGSSTLVLGCLQPSESAELIRRAVGPELLLSGGAENVRATRELCDRLGHLPLALGMAAAYMQRCDVNCDDYLARFVKSEQSGQSLLRCRAGKLHDYSFTVAASLSLSLVAIQKENIAAADVLLLFCFLGPDQITKGLIRYLLHAKNEADQKRKVLLEQAEQHDSVTVSKSPRPPSPTLINNKGMLLLFASSMIAVGGAVAAALLRKRDRQRLAGGIVGAAAILSVSSSVWIASSCSRNQAVFATEPRPVVKKPTITKNAITAAAGRLLERDVSFSASEFEQADQVWNTLKSYSLLTVKEGKGSVHRLLAQALRETQTEQQTLDHLEICIHAIKNVWTFRPDRADTWQDSLNMLEHVKSLVSHSFRCNNMSSSSSSSSSMALQTSILSKEVGVLFSMALNDFAEAQASLELSLKLLDKTTTTTAAAGSTTIIGTHYHRSQEYPREEEEACCLLLLEEEARAEALHELGRVFRYEGKFEESEKALSRALDIRNHLVDSSNDNSIEYIPRRQGAVADTLHELGVLEKKKYNLDSAAEFLQRSLALRRNLYTNNDDINNHTNGNSAIHHHDKNDDDFGSIVTIDADCANTLHQLAAVHVAQKPPSLQIADSLLKEALGLSRHIGQRAATLKELARVAIRQGSFDRAETYLAQAFELYVELYGTKERMLHINVAAVKFQQGALAFQREQLDKAWIHFSECLRIRRHVYGYARITASPPKKHHRHRHHRAQQQQEVAAGGGGGGGSSSSSPFDYDKEFEDPNPTHLEVSSVLHELGCVAIARGCFSEARDMLNSEGIILERLEETTSSQNTERIMQARWTNLTWLRKCAKEMGDEEAANQLMAERTKLKKKHHHRSQQQQQKDNNNNNNNTASSHYQRRHNPQELLQQQALNARLLARSYALVKGGGQDDIKLKQSNRHKLIAGLLSLENEIKRSPPSEMRDAAQRFLDTIQDCLQKPLEETPLSILQSCDALRDVLRSQGLRINDKVTKKSKEAS